MRSGHYSQFKFRNSQNQSRLEQSSPSQPNMPDIPSRLEPGSCSDEDQSVGRKIRIIILNWVNAEHLGKG